MKVLDLQCQMGHRFEAWFGSEADFQDQHAQGMVACPLCGDAQVSKLLSAPRLNLTTTRKDKGAPSSGPSLTHSGPDTSGAPGASGSSGGSSAGAPAVLSAAAGAGAGDATLQQLQAAWLALSRELVARSEDVGTQFADEARKMHYGEVEERAIRGQTSMEEARALHEEGIAILPLAIPDGASTTLH